MATLQVAAVAAALTTLIATPTLIAWLVVRADDLAGYAADVIDKLPGRTEDPSPRHPPIEETAARLRRLTDDLRSPVSVPVELAELERAELRREALWISYDETLREACRALGVPQQLDSVVGVGLELERLRVEGALSRAGLRWRA